MADEILFVGGRKETITVLSGTVVEHTDVATFNSTYSDCSLRLTNPTHRFKVDLYSESSNALNKVTVSGTKVFIHFVNQFVSQAQPTTGAFFSLVDSSGYPWFSIRGSVATPGNLSFNIFWNSGTGPSPVWTELGSSTNITTAIETWDVEFTFGTPHSVNVYKNGSLWRSGTFTQGLFTDIAQVEFGAAGSTAGTNPIFHYSQIIVTDNISTIGSFVQTSRATAVGTNAGFSGNHTAVNEVVGTDTTIQSATTAGLRTTHVMSDVVVPTGLEIKTVFHWLRAKNDGSAPNNIRSVLRSGGIDYVTPDLPLINVGYSPVGARYNVDPLGSNWIETTWNSIEAGYESAT